MSSDAEQTTLAEATRRVREQRLVWTPNNPDRGAAKPDLHEPTLKDYLKDPRSLPYDVPTPGTEEQARNQHRTWYWPEHAFELFVCPDCDRSVEEVRAVDIHHIDEDPHNGAPENLVALCQRCHQARHSDGDGLGLSSLTVEEWRERFIAELGGGERR